MKLSCALHICVPGVSPLPLEEAIKLLSRIKYPAIEIPAGTQANPDEMTRRDVNKLKEILATYDLKVSAFTFVYPPTGYRLADPSPVVRRRSVEYSLRLIDQAFEMSVPTIVWGSSHARNIPEEVSRGNGMPWLLDLLREAAEYAEDRDVTIAIEPINRRMANVINTVLEAVEIAREINSPAVKVVCDTYHMDVENESFRDSILKAGKLVGIVHVADNDRKIPGRGYIDFKEVFDALREIKYDQYVTLEAALSKDPTEELIEAKRYLEKFL